MENEFRVRPVTRFVVTHYHSGEDAEGRGFARCQTYGEFNNTGMAEKVAKALHDVTPDSTFAGVMSEAEPLGIFYAYTPEQAERFMLIAASMEGRFEARVEQSQT